MSREFFLLAGEASGDARGAEFIREIRRNAPDSKFSGMGGPLMKTEGMEILADVTPLAVVGIIEVLKHYGTFKQTMDLLLSEIQQRKPAAVIGIDYPGFNLRLLQKVGARRRRAQMPKLIQYVSPQLWAWDEGRKWKMAHYLDLVLCIFPFEPEIYRDTGLKAVFVGHPLADSSWFSEETRDPRLVALFPGSREKEIRSHMPVFVEMETKNPGMQFTYASNNPRMESVIRSYSPGARIEDPSFLYAHARAGIVCSGTATLEACLAGLPICVIYRVAWLTYWMGRNLIKVPYLAMPNLLAKRELVKELIQSDFRAEKILMEIERLLRDQPLRKKILEGYQEIRKMLRSKESGSQLAEEILRLTENISR